MRTVHDVPEVKNHWWWRPGWRTGRHFYACHVTFDHEPEVQELVRAYQEPLKPLSGLDLIPTNWLHLTMQGIGFVDEVSTDEIQAITESISEKLASLQQPTATFARPVVQSEAILIPALPVDVLDEVRANVHDAIADVLGIERTPDADLVKAFQGYRPHVSIAYVNVPGKSEPYIEALRGVSLDPVTVPIRNVSVLTFHRDDRMYEWTKSVSVPVRA